MNRATDNTSVTSLHIVVVEDDYELRDILVAGLHYFGHRLRGVSDGQALDRALAESPADIIILDLGLPGEDGIAIARRLRNNYNCGVVMVTARGMADERVLGRESGADLYFVKPVNIQELNAALINLAHRLFKRAQAAWRFTSRTSTLHTPQGVTIHLTAQECLLMQKLLEVPGTNVPRREIFKVLNQPDDIYADKRLETLISRLRSKVKSADTTSELPVRARHNMGYAFLAEVSA
ncbi:MAG: response regulator transcription factor [Desulfuromonadaceae bacterium]|nr:response regulator transcription factor [Desulfuromonadaceae bacterium]